MTRHEAERIAAKPRPDRKFTQSFIDTLEELGLLKFDPDKPVKADCPECLINH